MFPSESFQDEHFHYFIAEAQDLLQSIEQDLLSLRQERSTAKIHNLMRAAHTLKGAAASVGQRTIQEVSHVLEDIFKALYSPNIVIDAEVESLLFDGYECLRRPIAAAIHDSTIDDSEVMNQAAAIIAQLQDKFGDAFNPDVVIPSSAELGFDMVQSMFEVGVTQRLAALEAVMKTESTSQLTESLRTEAEMFLGFAESLSLPGFGEIARLTLSALEQHPDQIQAIATVALQDFSDGRSQVLAGDRTVGGSPSAQLRQLAGYTSNVDLDELELGFIDHQEARPDHDPLSTSSVKYQTQESQQGQQSSNINDTSGQIETLLEDVDLSSAYSFLHPEELITDTLSAQQSSSLQSGQPTEQQFSKPEEGNEVNHPDVSNHDANPLSIPTADPGLSAASRDSKADKLTSQSVTPGSRQAIRVELEHLDTINYFTGELLINQNRQATQQAELNTHVQVLLDQVAQHQQLLYYIQDDLDQILIRSSAGQVQSLPHAASQYVQSPYRFTSNGSTPTIALPEFDPLEMDRYSELHAKVQLALSHYSKLESVVEALTYASKQTQHTVKLQQRLLTHVRDDLTEVRMTPIAVVLNRLPRVIQQLEATHHKPIQLTLTGTDILIDKAIAEKLYDPLLHLIRNAFDHGIESENERRSQGKPLTGKINIHVSQQGNRTRIEIRDDGRGIDLKAVAKRAVQLNLVTLESLHHYSDDQILNFLFEPGFSTRNQVSNLSGRGVGLDIVREQVSAMQGTIAIQSTPQQGTAFILMIPLSLTVAKLMVCQAQGTTYALPVHGVNRVMLPQLNSIYSTASGQSALKLWHQDGEKLIPLVQLSSLISYSENSDYLLQYRKKTDSQPSVQPILLLDIHKQQWAVQVDRILGEQELVIRPLEGITPPPYIYGGAIMGNNDLALAIDPELLILNQHEKTSPVKLSSTSILSLPESTKTHSLPDTRMSRVLLVVDDSATLRHTLTKALEREGYEVLQANDGQEALETLEQRSNIALVLCDIEMPRLNGFEFLSLSRQQIQQPSLPIVMLTSRNSEKHRHLALALGANAYLTKPYAEKELLHTVAALIQQARPPESLNAV